MMRLVIGFILVIIGMQKASAVSGNSQLFFPDAVLFFEELAEPNTSLSEKVRAPAQTQAPLVQCQNYWRAQSGSIWNLTQTLETEPGKNSLFICNGTIRNQFPRNSNQACVQIKTFANPGADQKVRVSPRKWALVGVQPQREFSLIFQDLNSAYQNKCIEKKSKDPACARWQAELGLSASSAKGSGAKASSEERFLTAWPLLARRQPFHHCSSSAFRRGLGQLGDSQRFNLVDPNLPSPSETMDFRDQGAVRSATILNY